MLCRKQSIRKRNATPEATVIAREIVPDDWSFDGLVVITIDYLECPEEGRPKCIRFSGKISGKENPNTIAPELKAGLKNQNHNSTLTDAATFICNCEYDPTVGSNAEGERVFKADKLTGEEAKTWFVSKYGEECLPFFSVHGYDNEPIGVMNVAAGAQVTLDKSEKKCKIVPVLWPSYGGIGYATDLKYAKEAVNELDDMYTKGLVTANVFEKKNLVCHSMGNLILRKAADSEIKFDNIFMVAADVDTEIFGNNYINKFETNSSDSENKKYHDGLRIVRMLKDGGKIYCIWNFGDWALSTGSYNYHSKYRLGMCGIGNTCYRKNLGIGPLAVKPLDGGLHTEFKKRFENIQMQSVGLGVGVGGLGHSYLWEPETIGYYRDKLGLN